MFTYLLIDLLIIAFPLALSFDKKVAFYQQWRYIWQGILLNMLVFIPWDAAFSKLGVWSFEGKYLLGLHWIHLPLEEYFFFLVVPYAALFIYRCLEVYFPKDYLFRWRAPIAWAIIFICLLIYLTHPGKLYTAVNCLYLSFALLIVLLSGRGEFLGRFFLCYLILIIPFFIFNGALTNLPVVKYNDAENMGIRLLNIPVDDFFYNMGMLLIPVANYVRIRK
ncbi:MAG: lycopene cyclase domain-containing protein [Bacteroidetes bacterium]|nr:lycopene cyclase domain-containing protein [Bacteroidota bacterium]